jgi:AcrR family transcriptional regulator
VTQPYHHGDLRRTLIEAAVAQIERDGLSNLSLRGIARTAGVSHAAPAHHFGDKVGLCTAVAAEGFTLLAARTTPLVDQPDALLQTGVVYILFAVEHRGYFEVMFRPDLHHAEDPELVAAREKSFDVLYRVARAGAGIADDQDVTGLAVAAWSIVHGFATLYLADNFREQLPDDLDLAAAIVAEGVASLGRTIAAQIS